MKTYPTTLVVFALVILYPLSALSQKQASSEPQDMEKVSVGTSEVMLDVVVKDKRGRAVNDLKASDLEVFEDGVRQPISSFRLLTRQAQTNVNAANNTVKTSPARTLPSTAGNQLSAVALVFDRLSPDSRARARAAAQDYLNKELATDEFVGVFAINLSLQVIQPYTNNAQLVKRGIESAGAQSSAVFTSTREQVRDLAEQQNSAQIAADSAASAGASSGSGGVGASGSAAMADAKLLEMTTRSLEAFESLERDQQGHATTNALIALINSMQHIYGRKAIIFFSEGITIPPAVKEQFRSVISNANRANVSVYTVDAAGLRVDSPTAETRREMLSRGQRRLNQVASGRDDMSGPMTRSLERNEDLLSLNPDSGLGQLADQTGGFLVSETNSIGPKLRQVDEDLRSYYLLSYVPQNQNYDGRFRQITVKLNRSGLDLQTRKGYYALNPTVASPLLSYEAPALAILGGARRPNSFPLHVDGFDFPASSKSAFSSILVEVPTDVLTFATSEDKKTYRTDFSMVTLIKNESQQVVQKLSHQYVLTGPIEKLEAAKHGEILFYRTAELPPGRYTIAAAAFDAINGQASVNTASLEVQDADETKLRLSSIAILKRVEKLSQAEQNTSNPFRYGDVLVYPNLSEPLRKSVDKELAFFLTAYVRQGAKDAPKLTIELLQQRHSLGRAALELPGPDASGRIQYASALPVERLQTGDYDLKVTIDDGVSSATRSEHFTIQ